MNLLDLAVLVAVTAAAFGGYRLGFVARVLSWTGLAVGVVLAAVFVEEVVGTVGDQEPQTRLLVALAFLFGLAVVGQALGLAVGAAAHAALPRGPGLREADRLAGGVAGACGVVVAVWLLVPALAATPGWPARAARESLVVRSLGELAPRPPESLAVIGRVLSDAAYGDVLGLGSPGDVGTPPVAGIAPGVAERVAGSVVKVEGRACDRIQDGTGFVVDGLVVTNAHVVAGESTTSVSTQDGRRLDARVVAFDARRDLAVLDVRDLRLPSLPLGTSADGATGAVFGHPGGGPLRAAPARVASRITARGTDIYRAGATTREVLVLAADLEPGDSGGPLVDPDGVVVGVAFAIDPASPATGYALADGEVRPVLEAAGTARVGTGPCLAR